MIVGDPLVTVVTPSFNQGRFIRDTIESVLSQDYPHIEYIVMDGGSTDETAQVVGDYATRLTFVSEPDRGQSHAINKGFERARGAIVAWLNSDDLYLPGAVRRAVERFKAEPHLGVAYGDGYQIDEQGRVTGVFPHTQHFDLWKLVTTSDYILQQSTFFRKAALDAIGPIREDLHYIMDWDLLIRLAKRFEFAYIPELMGCLREYATAKTSVGGAKRVREIADVLCEQSGLRFSPGYLVYGLATYEALWTRAIDRWPRGVLPLALALRTLVSRACYRVIGVASRRGQAWHRDGWMGPSAYLMLPYGSGEAVFRGFVPEGVPGLAEQRVAIAYRGRTLRDVRLKPGPFEVRFTVPAHRKGCPMLHVKSKTSFVFAEFANSSDTRRLSLFGKDVRWLSAQ